MIPKGAARSNGAFFAWHLMRTDHNERVTVMEMRGFSRATDLREAFREMEERAEGSGIENYFYHASLSPYADERLTDEQWMQAIDIFERRMGLDGQQRFVIGHGQETRDHVHVVWSRVYLEQVGPEPGNVIARAVSDSHNYRRHEDAAREIEAALDLKPVERCLTRDKAKTPRQERTPADWETFRAQESKIDPQAMKAELTDLWQRSDSGPAFAAALEAQGYILARGDRRDFCVIDAAGDEHSLGRRIAGVKAAEIRSRMEDVDREALPSVEEGRALARQRQDEPPQEGGTTATQAEEKPTGAAAPVDAQQPAHAPPEASLRPADPTRAALAEAVAETVKEAQAQRDSDTHEEPAAPGERGNRFMAWCATAREQVTAWGRQARDYWNTHFQRQELEPAAPEPSSPSHSAPGTTVAGPTPAPERLHNHQPGWGPEP